MHIYNLRKTKLNAIMSNGKIFLYKQFFWTILVVLYGRFQNRGTNANLRKSKLKAIMLNGNHFYYKYIFDLMYWFAWEVSESGEQCRIFSQILIKHYIQFT